MSERFGSSRVRALLERYFGVPAGEPIPPEVEAAIGMPLDQVPVDPEEFERLLAGLRETPPDAFEIVEPVFQATVVWVGENRWLDPATLAAQSPGVRMLLVTRAVDGSVGNSGWVSMFVEEQADLVPTAIEGYRLLGLDDHADLAERVLAHGFDPDVEDDAAWEAFDAAWFALPDPEAARAAYIAAHPAEFATG